MIKLLRHLKARFGQKRTAPPPASAPIAEPAIVSRVQQNLAWLPVHQEPEPLNSPPPRLPALGQGKRITAHPLPGLHRAGRTG